ncbi:hypothetical protein C8A00DRAFT_36711 [Chaetomidium leptoderma]|uniref:Uncharacterized protein n=1 Tax=Chaetomidium leptoderma TaxID=669021 RepID=A0AAN6VFT5_9PEZI|nr:hypothetical protein C8A00DRAFT_36711 [Chaetomidium leptoderma]
MGEDYIRHRWGFREDSQPDLAGFSGLEELTLDGLYGDLPWWTSQIVRVLKSSPSLHKLRLSLSSTTLVHYDGAGERKEFDDYFDQLCEKYGDTAAAPYASAHYTSGPFLEQIHIENTNVYGYHEIIDIYAPHPRHHGILFDAFGPAHCPNLRRFTVAEYSNNVHHFLATVQDASSARRLAVSCRNMKLDYELAALLVPSPEYPSLPLHLRMLNIDLTHGPLNMSDVDDDDREDQPGKVGSSPKQVLENLVLGDNGTLEGLAVHMAEDPDVEGDFENQGILVDALAKLANGTQLVVVADSATARLYELEQLVKVAQLLADAAPRLRYIGTYERYYWRVCRSNRDDTITLGELDEAEVGEVELFRESIWDVEIY